LRVQLEHELKQIGGHKNYKSNKVTAPRLFARQFKNFPPKENSPASHKKIMKMLQSRKWWSN